MKSSLKFCVIASGEYDLYVAEPRACEWDIAAGHAILKNAGGLITDFENNEILYGSKGLYGATSSANVEQISIVRKTIVEITAIFDLTKL